MVRKPVIAAEFHPGLRPRVEICALNQDGSQCTFLTGFSPSQVSLSLADQQYQVNWDTKSPAISPDRFYRIQVLLGDNVIGHADVDAVANGSQLKSVDTDEYIGLVDGRTLPIKFFLGKGVTCDVNPANCAEYTVSAATGGTFESADNRAATVIPAGVSPVAEFTLSIEKVPLQASQSCHGAPRLTGTVLVREYNDCYKYTTFPDIFAAGGFATPPKNADGTYDRSKRVVVAMCVDKEAAGDLKDFLQIFKSDPHPRPLYALEDAEEGVDFPSSLLDCESTVGTLPPPLGSGFLAALQYNTRRLAGAVANFVTPKSAYAIDLGEGGFLGIGDGYSDFRWGVQGHIDAVSPTGGVVAVGTSPQFSVRVEAHTHHHDGDEQSASIPDADVDFTLIDPAGLSSAPVRGRSSASGVATAAFALTGAGEYQVVARHANGGDAVTFTVTASSALALPVSSSINLIASASVNAGTEVRDEDTKTKGATFGPLAADVAALAGDQDASVLAEGRVAATWQDGANGQVVFTRIGWTSTAAGTNSHAQLNQGTDWTYTFTAIRSGTFTLQYTVSLDEGSTASFGLNGIDIHWGVGTAPVPVARAGAPTSTTTPTTGTFTREVVAGTTYTVRLRNFANVFGPLGTQSAHLSGTFNWSVAPPPIIT
jgi:hypothetical protein